MLVVKATTTQLCVLVELNRLNNNYFFLFFLNMSYVSLNTRWKNALQVKPLSVLLKHRFFAHFSFFVYLDWDAKNYHAYDLIEKSGMMIANQCWPCNALLAEILPVVICLPQRLRKQKSFWSHFDLLYFIVSLKTNWKEP